MLYYGALACTYDDEIVTVFVAMTVGCTAHHHADHSGNWVVTITPSSSSSQSAEQSAESSHMPYLGLCCSPSTCQDTRSRRRDQNKPSDWSTAGREEDRFLKEPDTIYSKPQQQQQKNTARAQHVMNRPAKIVSNLWYIQYIFIYIVCCSCYAQIPK